MRSIVLLKQNQINKLTYLQYNLEFPNQIPKINYNEPKVDK